MANTQTGAVSVDYIDKRRGRDFQGQILSDSKWTRSVNFLRKRLGGLATVTADGVNTITVDDASYLSVGDLIDVVVPTTGIAPAIQNRQVTAIAGNVVTYSGADAASTNGHIVCVTGRGTDVVTYAPVNNNRLDLMTVNDMVNAARLSGDSAGI